MTKLNLTEAVSILEADDHNQAIEAIARLVIQLDRQETELEDKIIKLDQDRDALIELGMKPSITMDEAAKLIKSIDRNFFQFQHMASGGIINNNIITGR